MQKLAAADASFLYAETSKCTSNIGSINVMKLAPGTTPSEFITSLKTYLAERAHLVPYMTRKLSYLPGNLDHPIWVQDDVFDIDNHVIEHVAPAPGDQAAMEFAVARVHEKKMALDRPLWAWHIITGLEDGTVAVYNQSHHSALDGASGNAAYEILMDETAEHPAVEPPAEDSLAADEISMLDMLENAMENFFRFQMESGNRMIGAMDTSQRLLQRAIDPSKEFGAMGKMAPETPFSKQITETRTWACGEMPLADVKAMGKSIGATINDMVLAICADGLRTYLERKGQLPEESLIAGCPVSVRKPRDTSLGNQVSLMTVELGTEIEDALERIFAIRASAATAKELVADLSGIFESNAALPGMPAMMSSGISASESMGLAEFFRGPINVCISNVPGPRKRLFANKAEMMTHYPISIATHGVGLNITVQSYCDQIFMGITACGAAVPDVDVLRDDLDAAFRKLRAKLLPLNVRELKRPDVTQTEVASVPQDQVA